MSRRPPTIRHRHITTLLMLIVLLIAPYSANVRAADGPPLSVDQRLVAQTADGPRETEQLVPGLRVVVRATFTNGGAAPIAVRADWNRMGYASPAQLTAEPDATDRSELFRLAPGESRSFERPVPAPPPAGEPFFNSTQGTELALISVVTGCILTAPEQGDLPCPAPAEAPLRAVRDILRAPLRANDLGDAPDSSNHAGAPMLAYPGVPAAFPTVFDPAAGAPSGPLHLTPQPFHLGRRVSLEVEADIGPDQDPTNNLEPAANLPNRDRADDGVLGSLQSLEHCKPATAQVQIFIAPAFQAAALAAGVTEGYLNLWLDGTRDGDWADAAQCATAAGATPAVEHILIDRPIDIAALSPGLNTLTLTTKAAIWPEQLAQRPAWLRATLSLAPSAKPLQAGELSYGDGRGRVGEQGQPQPFRYGETEDYLINRGDAARPDVQVRKGGRVALDPESGRPVAVWTIEYRNAGDAPAQNVALRDELAGQSIIAVLIGLASAPELPSQPDGAGLSFTIGTLAPGAGGRIVIRTELPAPGSGPELVVNTASIRADADADPSNNSARAELRPVLPAPVIVSPGSGATCDPELTVAGRAVPGATVRVFDESGSIDATAVADANGRWKVDLTLSAGRHRLFARASLGGHESRASEPVSILVDPTLPYDPLSLRFAEEGQEAGARPIDGLGRSGDGGWRVRLKPNTRYTVSVRSCCETTGAALAIRLGDGAQVALGDVDGDGVFSATFSTGALGGPVRFLIIVVCAGERSERAGELVAAPVGRVIDGATGQPIAGAELRLQPLVEGPAGQEALPYFTEISGIGGDDSITDALGRFTLPALPGRYNLRVDAPGYQGVILRPELGAIVPPSGGEVNDWYGCITCTVTLMPRLPGLPRYQVIIDELGFDTQVLRVRPGAVVAFLNLDIWEHAIKSPRDSASGQASGKALSQEAAEPISSGQLAPGGTYERRFDEPGTYTIGDGENGYNTLTVIVSAEAPPPDGGYRVMLPLLQR